LLFNSIDFAIFLPIVFIGYWFVFHKNVDIQNVFIVIASYIFYGWWDWRFLILIFLSTLLDFMVGLGLAKTRQDKTRQDQTRQDKTRQFYSFSVFLST
jgi:D-alanyl-lipoteichoic acid acyltransferase DltB (MBOAT superfamily)